MTGELLVKGPTLFKGYLGKPKETDEAMTRDGYFKTGDIVSKDSDGYYRILGRKSADIIKCAGHKVSALEVEAKLHEHPRIAEATVLGVPHEIYGEIVAALVRPEGGEPPVTDSEVSSWAASHLAPYKVPRKVKIVERIPKNAVGKVNKPNLKRDAFGCVP